MNLLKIYIKVNKKQFIRFKIQSQQISTIYYIIYSIYYNLIILLCKNHLKTQLHNT